MLGPPIGRPPPGPPPAPASPPRPQCPWLRPSRPRSPPRFRSWTATLAQGGVGSRGSGTVSPPWRCSASPSAPWARARAPSPSRSTTTWPVAGLQGLLLTRLDRDGTQVTSRLGVAAPAVEVGDDIDLFALAVARGPLDYLVCDEAQFYAPEQCDQLARIVDELDADVYAFGLITDFRGVLFDGTKRLLEVADERVRDPGRGAVLVRGAGHAQRPSRQRPGRLRGRRRRGRRHGGRRGPALRRRGPLRAALPPPLPRRHARLSATSRRRACA